MATPPGADSPLAEPLLAHLSGGEHLGLTVGGASGWDYFQGSRPPYPLPDSAVQSLGQGVGVGVGALSLSVAGPLEFCFLQPFHTM